MFVLAERSTSTDATGTRWHPLLCQSWQAIVHPFPLIPKNGRVKCQAIFFLHLWLCHPIHAAATAAHRDLTVQWFVLKRSEMMSAKENNGFWEFRDFVEIPFSEAKFVGWTETDGRDGQKQGNGEIAFSCWTTPSMGTRSLSVKEQSSHYGTIPSFSLIDQTSRN